MTDGVDYEPPSLTRREALKGGSAAAVAVGAYMLREEFVQAVRAQTNEPRIKLGASPDYVIDDDPDGNGNLRISHPSQGPIFEYDPNSDSISALKQIDSVTTDQLNQNNIGAKAIKDTSQTISSSNQTTVQLDTASFEDTDFVTVDTANDQLLIQESGLYIVSATISYGDDVGSGTHVQNIISVNGTARAVFSIGMGANVTFDAPLLFVRSLSANDAIMLQTYQDSGGSLSLRGSERNNLAAIRIG